MTGQGNPTLLHILEDRRGAATACFTWLDADGGEAARLSHHLLVAKARGRAAALMSSAAPGSRVLIVHQPGLDFAVSFLACLFARLVAVPLYPLSAQSSHPSVRRFRTVVLDSEPSLILCDDADQERLQRMSRRSTMRTVPVVPDSFADTELGAWQDTPLPAPTDIAYLQYTSGSTARPRGVVVAHGHVAAYCKQFFSHVGLSGWRWVGWLPPAHDFGLLAGLLRPLYGGFDAVNMAPATFLRSPALWLQAISRYRGTMSAAPNFAYEMCVGRVSPADLTDVDLSSWRLAQNGSEPVEQSTMISFQRHVAVTGFSPAAWSPCYGLAEATVGVSVTKPGSIPSGPASAQPFNRVPAVALAGSRLGAVVSCGQPLPDVDIAIVAKRSGRPLPDGVEGEIWVRGPNVADGYWNKPALSKRFFRATLATDHHPSAPFLRTGDCGFLLKGELYITGRLKDVVSIRGVTHHAYDLEAVVRRRLRLGGGTQVAAFTSSREGAPRLVVALELGTHSRPRQLAAAVQRSLSEIGVQPDEIILVEPKALPRTTSGKLRRSQLAQAYARGRLVPCWSSAADASALPPMGSLGRRIRTLMCQVLTRSSLGADDDFFLHGGDSLKAALLVALLEQELGASIPANLPFKCSTAARMAAYLRERSETAPQDRQPSAGRSTATWVPAPTQQQPYVTPGPRRVCIPLVLRLTGPLDVDRLEHALRSVAQTADVFSFEFRDGPRPCVRASADQTRFTFACRDAHEHTQLAAQLYRASLLREVDLRTDSVGYADLVRVGPELNYLALGLDHVAFDSEAVALYLTRVSHVYGGTLPPEQPARYIDYASWQASHLDPRRLRAATRYWANRLRHPVTPFPERTCAPGSSMVTTMSAHPKLGSAVLGTASQARSTPFAVLCANLAVQLSRYTGASTITIGAALPNRGGSPWSSVLGPLASGVFLRMSLTRDMTFIDAARVAHRAVSEALAEPLVPFAQLLARRCVPWTNVQIQTIDRSLGHALSLPGIAADRCKFSGPAPHTGFALDVRLAVDDTGLRGTMRLREGVVGVRASTWRDAYVRQLEALCGTPNEPIERIACLNGL